MREYVKEIKEKVQTLTPSLTLGGSTKTSAPDSMHGKPAVKIIALSGTEGVTKNMTVYECGNDIIIVDCGIGFPDDTMPGIDVVIPDFSYLLQNKEKVRGLIVSHGHEDHLGAIPYLLKELNIPIYAHKFVQELIKSRLGDKGSAEMLKQAKFHLIGADVPEVQLGNFSLSTFKVNHSVPNSLGLCINTPQGRILHMADYKVDWTPILDEPIDLGTIARYGKEGVLCLLSDCLGSTTEGYSKSERALSGTFHDLFERGKEQQIMVTTISSNISRMHQIIDAALSAGRKVAFGGRSIEQSTDIARNLELLQFDQSVFVKVEQAVKMDQREVVYIIAGCYGQQGSTLDRISRDEHKFIQLEENAMIIFSADPNPPGADVAVERVMDNLTLRNAEVLYSQIQDDLHVSGHGPKGDLTIVASLVRPKYFIPIGGTITKVRAYKNMVGELGFNKDHVFELLEGASALFENGEGKLGPTIEVSQILVDGNGAGPIGEVVIKDREYLSNEGMLVIVVPMSKDSKTPIGKTDIVTRGFVYVKESKALMGQTKDMINKMVDKYDPKTQDWGQLQNQIERKVQKFLLKETGRKPMIVVHAIFV